MKGSNPPECPSTDCIRSSKYRGLCGSHYGRWYQSDDFRPAGSRATPLPLRLEQGKLIDESGCWNWTGHLDTGGYGKVFNGSSRKVQRTHRAAYELFVGSIPPGFEVDHLCRNRRCFNPEHLEAVPPAVNYGRSAATGAVNIRTGYCKRGHEYSGENVLVAKDGRRSCRACRVLTRTEWQRKHRTGGAA